MPASFLALRMLRPPRLLGSFVPRCDAGPVEGDARET
jgi:hypothetical protein